MVYFWLFKVAAYITFRVFRCEYEGGHLRDMTARVPRDSVASDLQPSPHRMHSLPFELISDIFYICAKQLHVPPEFLSSVDGHLRAAALQSSRLWSDIYWEPSINPKSIYQQEKALAYLERSGSSPVTLELRITGEFLKDDQLQEDVALRLCSHLHHIRSLAIFEKQGLNESWSDVAYSRDFRAVKNFLSRLDAAAPILDEFGVEAFHDERPSRNHPLPQLQFSQIFTTSIRHRLQTLRFSSALDPSMNFTNFTSLATIRMFLASVDTWEACLTGLSSLPALKRLTLDDRGLRWSGFERPMAAPLILLSELLQLEIISIEVDFLNWLECPKVEEVLIGPWETAPGAVLSNVVPFLERHRGTIQHLTTPSFLATDAHLSSPARFPKLLTYHGCHQSQSGAALCGWIRPSMLRHLVLLIEKIEPIEIARLLQSTSDTIESITIRRHIFSVHPSRRPDSPEVMPRLIFHALRKYVTTCWTGDKLFECFASAPMLEEMHLNGEPRPDDFPVRYYINPFLR